MRSHVYFLRTVGSPGKIKIGSSIWPWARLNFDRCRDWIIGGRSVGTPAKISQRAGR